MNVWFGTDWGAPVCQTTEHVETPVGQPCLWCEEPIADGDDGIGTTLLESVNNALTVTRAAYHLECFVRQFTGSVAHQLRVCRCYGGPEEEDAPNLSRREAAKAAAVLSRELVRDADD